MSQRQCGRRGMALATSLIGVACARTGLNTDDFGAAERPTGIGNGGNGPAMVGPNAGGSTSTAGRGGVPGAAGAGGDAPREVPFTSCPKAGSVAGINSWVRLDFPASVVGVSTEVLSVSCHGVEVSGTLHQSGKSVAFRPDGTLPPNSTCTATLSSDLMLDGIGPVAASSFTFSTSDALGTAFAFEGPRAIDEGGYAEGLATDGQDVLAYWTRGDLFFAVSRDGGETFGEPVQLPSGFGEPYVGDVRVALRNGTAQLFWRVLPTNSPGYAFHARLDDLALSRGPTLFMPEEDDVNVVNVGMGSDGAGNLRVAWSGPVLCGGSFCPQEYGVWSASSADGGETWLSHGRVEPVSGGNPEVVWTESGFLTAWLSDKAVRVFDQHFVEVVALSVTGGDVWPFMFLPNGSDDALLSWRESRGSGVNTTYLSLLLEGTFTPAQAMYTEADDRENSFVRFAPTRTDDVGMLQCVGQLFGEVERSVSVSVDRGDSFREPQVLDFLRAAGDDPRGEDSFCPAMALDADGRLHLLWDRYIEDPSATAEPGGVLYARGEPIAPCSE